MLNIFSNLDRRIGLDLGSSRTRIWLDQEGLVLDEASALAVDQRRSKVIAVGDEALAMKERVREPIVVFEPIKQPKISDDELLLALIKAFLQKVSRQHYFFNPVILASLAHHTSPAIKQVISETIRNLGAKEVLLVSQPLASAIGAGVPIVDASGCFLIQLGGGMVEAAAISLGKVIQVNSSQRAGKSVDAYLKSYFYQEHFLTISLHAAEKIKINLGTTNDQSSHKMVVAGQNWQRQRPEEIEASSQEVRPVIDKFVIQLEKTIKSLLAQVPPDLTTDAVDKGLLLAGGLSQLNGLDQTLTEKLSLPVSVVEEPDLAVARGLGNIARHLEEFKQSVGYQLD